MGFLRVFYNSFILGLLVSIILFQNIWLEMRVNVGIIIPIIILVSLIVYLVSKNKTEISNKLNIKFTVINLIVSGIIIFTLLGINDMSISTPAIIIREAIGITSISFSIINMCITLFLILGLITISIKDKRV